MRVVTAAHRAGLGNPSADALRATGTAPSPAVVSFCPHSPAGSTRTKERVVTLSRVRAIKVPPYSVHSEKVVLGSMIAQPKLIAPMNEVIQRGEIFFRIEHARIFDALIEVQMRHKPTTTDELIHALGEHKAMERLGGESLLRELARVASDPGAVNDQARVVAEKAQMRELIEVISDSLHDAYYSGNNYGAVLERTKARLEELDQATT